MKMRALLKHDGGGSAAEFALVVPLLIILFGGIIPLIVLGYVSLFRVERRLSTTISTVVGLMVVIGVFAMLYVRERRMWVWLEDDGSGGTQVCGGNCRWDAACTGQSCSGAALQS